LVLYVIDLLAVEAGLELDLVYSQN